MRLSRLVKISWVIILLQQLIPESFRLPIFWQKYYGCHKQFIVINLYQQYQCCFLLILVSGYLKSPDFNTLLL